MLILPIQVLCLAHGHGWSWQLEFLHSFWGCGLCMWFGHITASSGSVCSFATLKEKSCNVVYLDSYHLVGFLWKQNQDGRTDHEASASYFCNCDFGSMANNWCYGKHPCWFGLWLSSTSNGYVWCSWWRKRKATCSLFCGTIYLQQFHSDTVLFILYLFINMVR